MGSVRVIVFNADESYGPTLRSTLLSFDSVRIVADVNDPALLVHVAEEFSADVLVVHLDPMPESIIPLAGEVAAAHLRLALFAVSESTSGELILSTMRLGFREFLTKPIDRGILGDALSKVAKQVEREERDGKLVCVVGTSGGVGATSIAVNLAAELASMVRATKSERTDGDVSVVDLDYRFGQVATMLDVSPTYTIADLAHSPERLERRTVERALVEVACGDAKVQVLSRPPHFVQCENITAANCVGVLSALTKMHTYVVVDGPNRYDVETTSVLNLADVTLLIFQLLVPSVRNAQRIMQGMEEAGFNLDRTRLIVNRTGRVSGPLELADVEETLGRKVYAEIPDDWATMSRAVNLGEPLIAHGPKTKVRAAICDLAKRIHAPDEPADDERDAGSKKGGRLLSKLFSDAN